MITKTEKEDIIAKIRAWLQSPEGQARWKELQQEVAKFNERLKEQEKVPWDKMHEPMDI